MEQTNVRRGGVLLHITSLPGPECAGTLGEAAYRFVDFLQSAGMRIWQVLPVGPTGYGESPYQSACALAGNPYMIDLALLQKDGYLPDYQPAPHAETGRADFETLRAEKEPWLRRAYQHSRDRLLSDGAFEVWQKQWPWLRDYALFMAIKQKFNQVSWMQWPDEDIRMRRPEAMNRYEQELREDVRYYMFLQFLFRDQWMRLRRYANERGIMILGDMPIYVAEDSSDVWANAKFFQLNCERRPKRVAGVPPDYFSEDGQLWGNPLYRWHYLRLHGYGFWMDRLRAMAQLYDSVRIDHFIGFANYYSVKAGEKTARNGKWVIGPGKAFFAAVKKKVPELNVVAEDLGAVNDRVRNLLAFCGYPGMKVLQFAYDGGGGDNSHQPQLYQPNCAAYTGTHDNDTSLGWWRACSDQTRRNLREALGEVDDSTVVWRMIKAVFNSRANIAMAPMQDFLGLDSAARMNTPGTVGEKNWRYRALSSDFSAELAARMRALCEESGRV